MNPETRDMIPNMDETPSPMRYSLPADNNKFRRNNVVYQSREERFFYIKNMPKIRARAPIQYTSLDGVSPKGYESVALRSSTLAKHIGGHPTARYRQVTMGVGERYDFTKPNPDGTGEFTVDYDRMKTIRASLENLKQKSTRKNDTFGSYYNDHVVVPMGDQHYFGRGNQNSSGMGLDEIQKAIAQTKCSSPRLPAIKADRGLTKISSAQRACSQVGPGAYNLDNSGAFPKSPRLV